MSIYSPLLNNRLKMIGRGLQILLASRCKIDIGILFGSVAFLGFKAKSRFFTSVCLHVYSAIEIASEILIGYPR